MSEYKKETATLVSITIIGVLALAVAANYLVSVPASSTGYSSGTSTTTSVMGSSSTTAVLCDQAHPLEMSGLTFDWSSFRHPGNISITTNWNNCGNQQIQFIVTGQNILVNATIAGEWKEYAAFIGSSGAVGSANGAGSGNLTEPLYLLTPLSANATITQIIGRAIAIDPATGQVLSAPNPGGNGAFDASFA